MIELWHNPRCSKSRQALSLLLEHGVPVRERRYLQEPPDVDELKKVHKALGHPLMIDMMRPGEKLFRELGLKKNDPDQVLLQAMADHPILIERPLALSRDRAMIGRPPERVLELL